MQIAGCHGGDGRTGRAGRSADGRISQDTGGRTIAVVTQTGIDRPLLVQAGIIEQINRVRSIDRLGGTVGATNLSAPRISRVRLVQTGAVIVRHGAGSAGAGGGAGRCTHTVGVTARFRARHLDTHREIVLDRTGQKLAGQLGLVLYTLDVADARIGATPDQAIVSVTLAVVGL